MKHPEEACAALAIRKRDLDACSSRIADADCRNASSWLGRLSTLSGNVGQIFAGVAWAQPYSAGNWKTSFRDWSDSQLSMSEDACITKWV